jgi:hypothetical protein
LYPRKRNSRLSKVGGFRYVAGPANLVREKRRLFKNKALF